MKTTLILLTLVALSAAAPQYYRRRGSTNAFGSTFNSPSVTNVNAQVTNVNSNQPGTLAFNGGLALASSQQVSGFGSTIGVNHAQAISQNIAIPVPGYNNRRYG